MVRDDSRYFIALSKNDVEYVGAEDAVLYKKCFLVEQEGSGKNSLIGWWLEIHLIYTCFYTKGADCLLHPSRPKLGKSSLIHSKGRS